MTDDESGSEPRTRLQKQAVEILDQDTEPIDLVSRLDFGYVEYNDQYPDWHSSTELRPMVEALFLKELEGYSFSELHRHLQNHPDDASALGFDDVPSRTTFGRAWRDRFNDDSGTR